MADIIEHITNIAEEHGWGVSVSDSTKPNIREVCFSQYTTFGQDFSFEVDLEGNDYSAFLESVSDYYEGYDPDEEALLWVGPDGHGKKGAPHRLSDIIKDMEEVEKMIEELLDALTESRWENPDNR